MNIQIIDLQKLNEKIFIIVYSNDGTLHSLSIETDNISNDVSYEVLIKLFFQTLSLLLIGKVPIADRSLLNNSTSNKNEVFNEFKKQAAILAQGVKLQIVEKYHGRYKYHGPAIITADHNIMKQFSMECLWDNYGKDVVIYPKI